LGRKKTAGLKDGLESKRKGMETHTYTYIHIRHVPLTPSSKLEMGRQENPGKKNIPNS
jgi:hypothetical protein